MNAWGPVQVGGRRVITPADAPSADATKACMPALPQIVWPYLLHYSRDEVAVVDAVCMVSLARLAGTPAGLLHTLTPAKHLQSLSAFSSLSACVLPCHAGAPGRLWGGHEAGQRLLLHLPGRPAGVTLQGNALH